MRYTCAVKVRLHFAVAIILLFAQPIAYAQRLSGATLTAISHPSGASVRIDGREVGTTPINGLSVEGGRRRLLIEKDGYEAYEEWVFFAAGTELRRDVTLSVATGTVEIRYPDSVDPETVALYVGSTRYPGSTIELAEGRYRVRIAAFGYVPIETVVDITSGEQKMLEPRFVPAALEILESHLWSGTVSRDNVSPFDRLRLTFRANVPARYRVTVASSDTDPELVETGVVSNDQAYIIEWVPPDLDRDERFELVLTVQTELEEVQAVHELNVVRGRTVAPRVISSLGRGTSLVRIPTGSRGTDAFAIGSGYRSIHSQRQELPVEAGFSIHPFGAWEASAVGYAAADTDGAEWNAAGSFTLSTPAVVWDSGNGASLVGELQLSGSAGFGVVDPWRAAHVGISLPVAVETPRRTAGLALQPGTLLDLEDPYDPIPILFSGSSVYFQSPTLFFAASSRIELDSSLDLRCIHAIDAMIQVSSLPSFVFVGAYIWGDTLSVGGRAGFTFLR